MNDSSTSGEQHLGTFWLLDLESAPPVEIVPRIAATFRHVDAEEASLLALAMEHDDATEVRRRFATGRRCYAAWVGECLVAYGWVSFKEEEIGELQLRIRLGEREAYIWNCVTLLEYRGRRLYPALLTYIVSQLRTEGLGRIWIGADSDNLASQTGIVRAGFQPVADMVLACVIAMRRIWLRGRPGVPEDLVMEALYMVFGGRAFVWQNAAAMKRASAKDT